MHVGPVLSSSLTSCGSHLEPPTLFTEVSNEKPLVKIYIIHLRKELVGQRLDNEEKAKSPRTGQC